MRFSKVITIFVFIFVFVLSLATSRDSYAQVQCPLAEKTSLLQLLLSYPQIDNRQTSSVTANSALTYFMTQPLFGAPADNVIGCVEYIKNKSGGGIPGISDMDCNEAYIEDYCTSLFGTYSESSRPQTRGIFQNAFVDGPAQGSLISLANNLSKQNKQPVPLNLAYFAKRQLEPIPFAQKAFAQSNVTFNAPLIGSIYEVWVFTRNIAFGVLAISMIVAGILIMSRKRINPQLSVTVQYALPRILIAFILIAFSYVIGATLATLGWSIAHSADAIFNSDIAIQNTLSTAWSTMTTMMKFGSVGFLVLVIIASLKSGPGLFLLILVFLMSLVILVMFLWFEIKMFLVLVKTIVRTIFGPFYIAWGAVPGKEEATMMWIKGLISGGAGIAAMGIGRTFTKIISYMILISVLQDQGQGNLLQQAFAPISVISISIFVYAFGLYESIKLPDKIDAMLLNKK